MRPLAAHTTAELLDALKRLGEAMLEGNDIASTGAGDTNIAFSPGMSQPARYHLIATELYTRDPDTYEYLLSPTVTRPVFSCLP